MRREVESVRDSYKVTGSDDDDNDEEEELSELGEEQVEELMPMTGLGGSDEEDDKDGEEDDDSDGDDVDGDDQEEGEEEDEGESGSDEKGEGDDADASDRVAMGAGWGRKKTGFYGGGEADDDSGDSSLDEDDEGRADRLEHAEVLRLQRQQAVSLADADFGELPAAAVLLGGKLGVSSLGGKLDLPAALGGDGAGVLVERLERDLTSLSEADRARLLEAEAPELTALLEDFKISVAEVRERLEPLHAQVRARQLPTSSGVALLQLKLQLLLSYCTNIAFYLLLKATGRTVRDHPVVAALLRHRVLIDRLAPLDKKMRYRVQKLLRTAADGVSAAETGDEMRLKPNPAALLTDGDAEEGETGDAGVYRPPRMAAVPYDEERGAGRKARQAERAMARASASRMVRELRDEFSEAPRQIHADDFGCGASADSQAVARLRHDEAELRAYEEANFTRLAVSKEQRRELKRRQAAVARGDELTAFDDDFSHLSSLAKRSRPVDEAQQRDAALRQYMASLEQRGKKSRAAQNGDAATPAQTREMREERRRERRMATARKRGEAGNDSAGESDGGGDGGVERAERQEYVHEPANEDYVRAAAAGSAKRQRKAADAEARAATAGAELNAVRREVQADDTAGAAEKRKADRQILKNRGLTRERKKIDRNPRVKNREKYRRVVIKRKGQVREARTADATYAGESSGINQNVTHSRRFG